MYTYGENFTDVNATKFSLRLHIAGFIGHRSLRMRIMAFTSSYQSSSTLNTTSKLNISGSLLG